MERTKQFGFVTVTFDEDEHGVKTIKKMKFLGSSKYEFKVDGGIEIEENEDGKLNSYEEIVFGRYRYKRLDTRSAAGHRGTCQR